MRILDGRHGTDAVTRVLVETGDGRREWTTVGVHANVIEASWLALADAVQYGLLASYAGTARVRCAVVRTRSAVALPAPAGPPVLCRAWRSLRDTGPAGGDR